MASLSSYSISPVAIAGVAVIVAAFVNQEIVNSLTATFQASDPILIRIPLALLGLLLVAVGCVRRVTGVNTESGRISRTTFLLLCVPVGKKSRKLADIRRINLAHKNEDRKDVYELRVIFEDRSEMYVGASESREKAAQLAETLKAATGARIG